MFFKQSKKEKNLFAPENVQHLNVTAYESKKEKILTAKAKKRLAEKNVHNAKVKYMIKEIQEREKKTVSDTYSVTLSKGIGSGKLKTKVGVAKMKGKQGNVSADNLAVPDINDSRMLARQVASWRVARTLNLRVLSNEKFGLTDSNKIVGISAMLPETAKSFSDLMKEQSQLMKDHNLSDAEKENYLGNAIFTGSIQKQLSDLQLLDALMGQTDRHHGNIFVDIKNQRVFGIDNDQSFGAQNRDLNGFNAIASFKIDKTKQDLGLEFTQNQIDINTAEKILALDNETLKELMTDRVGRAYGEQFHVNELEAAKQRLAAIKTQIYHLKENDRLIKKWSNQTYRDSLDSYGGLAKEWESLSVFKTMNANMKNSGTKYQNYIAREVNSAVYERSQGGYKYVGNKGQEYKLVKKYRQALGGVIG